MRHGKCRLAVRVCSDVNIFNFILSFIPEISAFNYFHQLVKAGNFNLGLSYISCLNFIKEGFI